MVLANDAEPDAAAGDPLEIGLLAFARDQGIDIHALRANLPRVSLRAFDSAWKFMRVTVDSVAGPRRVLKGAPEVLLDRSHLEQAQRGVWMALAQAIAIEGYRVYRKCVGSGKSGSVRVEP